MIIYVVQEGDTISSIADQYEVSPARLIQENGITEPNNLVVGQTIVITFPEQVYTVEDGDTLESIAATYNISLQQLYRNNPFLIDRNYIYPGETLILSYGQKKGSIATNGYTSAFIDSDVLKKTLPYLTYITIFGNMVTQEAEIIEVDDSELIQIAKEYQVAPIMLLSTLDLQGNESFEITYNILNNDNLVNILISNLLKVLKTKGYYGVSLSYQYITDNRINQYEKFTKRVATVLEREGFAVFITFARTDILVNNVINFEKLDYSKIAENTSFLTLLNYNWGYTFGPPIPIISISNINEFVDYLLTQVPSEKISLGQPLVAYDWHLPYIIGVTKANSLTLDSAIVLAYQTGAVIQFDENSQTPYFEYTEKIKGGSNDHIVWFIDARSINALLTLVSENKLNGTAIWNIMNYFPQNWLLINSQYEIETLSLP